ncbi:MAG: carboxypeptidase regulatory-like domain-containing protein [Bacteroidales bacterium]|nr:carboxypeptidase regulatory-like domain-containing protein [Bacteroidales bacterium]MCF8403169.1 carboxypeptidase regulatory-like domain-containing protein [Bacteroidales bacterium]
MKNMNKLLIVLISLVIVSSGLLAQSDSSPKLNNQTKERVKPTKSQLIEMQNAGFDKAPSALEQLQQAFPDRDIASAYYPSDRDVNAKATPIPSEDLFDLQFEWPVGVGGGEAGIETDGNYIYTTKWNGTIFYRYEMNGTYLEEVTCGSAGAVRDLAYNGTYFYGGAAANTVFEMDLATGTYIGSFTAPTAVRAIAYDEDEDAFYANNWGTDIIKFDASGANLGSFPVGPTGDSYYGFAYQGSSYCGDGPYLWGFAQVGTNLCELIQIELPSGTETGTYFDVGSVVAPASAGGLCIDDNLYTGTWTIMGTNQNVNIWGLELCTSGPLPTTDVGVTAITAPNSGVNLTNAEAVTVTVKNFGTAAQSNFDVSFSLDGGTAVVETISATINGGETYNHTFATTVDLSAYGSYDFEACTELAGDENTANDCKTKTVVNESPSLCAPTYSSGCVVGDGFTDFAVEEIQNLNNGCANNTGVTGWSQYFELGPATLLPGVTHTFTFGTGYSSQHVNVWIDYNDDLDLTSDELILEDYILTSAGVLYDVDIDIPGTALPGEHVMRVMAVWLNTFTDPCGSYSYGEAEDYKVFLGVAEYGTVEGYVTEFTGGAPVDGATVTINNGTYSTTSGTDGYYMIDNVLVGTWPISCSATGYNVISGGTVDVTNGGTSTIDFGMTAPTMDITPTAINIVIDPENQDTEMIDIANNGDGTLGWSASLEMLTDDPKDTWDLQFTIDLTTVTGAAGNAGAECDGQYYYSTRWASNLIHKYDLDGNLIEEFSIPGVTGLRDLAFDGTYMYGGAAGAVIFEMDFVTKTLVSSISNAGQARSIAYDEGNDAFWITNFGSDAWLIDKSGATLNTVPNATLGLAGMYGSAYDNTTGSPYLWIFDQGAGAGSAQLIHQFDLTTLTMTGFSYDVLTDLGPNASAIAGGLFMVDNVYPGLWSIGGLLQGTPDVLFMYEFAPAGAVWISIDPTGGVVDPGNMDQMTVSFDATGITPGTIKTANIHFTSDPDVGMVTVPVTMQVGDQDFGFIEGNVNLTGSTPYNFEDVQNVLVEAGPYWANPDASGNYQIVAYPGTFDVTATLYGYTQQTVTGVTVAPAGTVTGIDFTLPTIYGRILGTVTDVDDGSPIENATVVLDGTDFETMTAADGTYEFFIEAGTYDMTVTHPTYTTGIATGVVVPVETDVTEDFALEYSCDYCDATTSIEDEWIMDVVCGTIQNLGTPWQGGIADYTDQFTIILPGFSVDISVENGNAWASDIVYVWVDWNMDCEFTPGGEEEFQLENVGGTGQTFTGQITAPANAPEGMVRMRVRMTYSTPPVPCGDATYGEIEEYSLLVGAGTYGELEGTVTELATGNPIEGAEIDVAGLYMTTTGSDGYYYFEEVFTGTWDVTCTANGYSPATASVLIEEGVLTVQDFALGAPELVVDPLIVEIELEPNQMGTETVNISNDGNATVGWSASLNILSENNGDDMFDLIWEVPVGVGGGEAGIETNGTYIYTTKWNGTGEYYRYGMDGTYIEQITVAGAAATRDMAYDGTYFYGGAAATTIFELDLDNAALISTFTAPTASRAIAYNETEDVFYANNWGTDITKFDKAGANLGSFPVGPYGDSYYGFAYDNYSAGAPYLWGYAQVGTNQSDLVQIQLPSGTETGVTFDVGSVLSAADLAGGLAIDDHIESGLWAFLGTCQNVNLWAVELTESQTWLSIAPTSGSLAPNTNEDMTLSFDATGLLPGEYYAEINFSTNPNVGSPMVEVTLTVAGLIPAINLNAVYNCTNVELDWEMPGGGNPDSWNVYRDGTLIGSATAMEYTDEMVDIDVEYSYTITAVYAGDESQPTPPFLITVPEPGDLEALDLVATVDVPNENYVTLEWDAPDACLAPDGYNIFRDGSQINAALVTDLTYVDESLAAGFYEYYVTAVYYFGESGASNAQYALVTGINELDANMLSIHPNPASDFVMVQSSYSIESFELLNNAGQVVISEKVNETNAKINVSDFESGIYYIKLKTSEGIALRKLAIK